MVAVTPLASVAGPDPVPTWLQEGMRHFAAWEAALHAGWGTQLYYNPLAASYATFYKQLMVLPFQARAGICTGGCSRGWDVLSLLTLIPGEVLKHRDCCCSPSTFPVLAAAVPRSGQIYHLGRGPKGQLVFGLFPGFPVTAGSFSVPTLPCNIWEVIFWSRDPDARVDLGWAALLAGSLAPWHQESLCLHLQRELCPGLGTQGVCHVPTIPGLWQDPL